MPTLTAVNTKRFHLALVIVFLLLIFSAAYRPTLSYGDHYSDANTLIAGENFAKYGFSDSYALPYFYFRGSYEACKNQGVVCADTHYPALPYLLNGGLHRLGFESLTSFKLFALCLSLIALLLLPRALQSAGLTEKQSLWASFFFLLHPFFWTYADNLHETPPNFLVFVLFLISWNRFLTSQKWSTFLVCALLISISTWITFEYLPFLPLYAGLTVLFRKKLKSFWPYLLLLGLIPCAHLAFRVYQQSFLWGDWHSSFKDLFLAAQKRVGLSWTQAAYHFQKRFFDFHLPALPLLFYFIYLRFSKKSSPFSSTQKQILWTFFLCSLAWWILMRQHAAIHSHISLLWLPFYSVLLAFLIDALKLQTQRPLSRFLFVLTLLLVMARSLAAPQPNRFFPFSKKEHFVLSQTEEGLNIIRLWAQQLPPETLINIEAESRAVSYHVLHPFQVLQIEQMCQAGSPPSILPKELISPDILSLCTSHFSQSKEAGPYLIFFN